MPTVQVTYDIGTDVLTLELTHTDEFDDALDTAESVVPDDADILYTTTNEYEL